ncbi:hypothetical protein SAMN04489729_1180 [Amycolatopsis lurida]|nr:hypothetical protein [Amycolatopsis lurida]SEC27111.1 hypothetical protein SAMN04489729_1180 [Amycolatopsis lurida]
MTHAIENPQSSTERVTVPEPRGEADALEDTVLELEPTIVLGRE